MLDTDFVVMDTCRGRAWMSRPARWGRDLVCRWTGHLLWRVTGSVRTDPEGSLDVQATYCRRCFKSGYVRGDYVVVSKGA